MRFGGIFDLDKLKSEIKTLEGHSIKQDFWDDHEFAQKTLKHLSAKKELVELWETLFTRGQEHVEILEMILSEWSAEMFVELEENSKEFLADLDLARIKNLLSHEHDRSNAIVSIHAGAGGTEACDWVAMLLRMYSFYAERHKYTLEFIDETIGEVAGIKSITFIVKGDYTYGYLKGEGGVHRLVRISPFDANKRRHTSFAAVEVFPEISDDVPIDINEKDLRIDTYRSSSAGGQHVNKTDSAIRITHLPTGIVAQCQNERSQHKNKEVAMKVLKARLYEMQLREKASQIEEARQSQKDIAFGSQIRSYVFQPYQQVKDMRTGYESGNVMAVMDGGIDNFIYEYLKWCLGENGQRGTQDE
jgi:peptide chain release factor 2